MLRLLVLLGVLAACGPNLKGAPDDRRGDTNGRMFDFVSSKPDGSEWTIRLRGDSMWVAYSTATEVQELGDTHLSAKEARRLWTLVDDLDLYGREVGEPDEEYGSVALRLREPTEDGEHDIITAYVPRDTDDEAVLDLADYLITLIQKHHDVAPAF